MMRIGYGYDAHRFIDGNYVMIAGQRIPHEYGIKAHSDGDVVLHAIGDALLGAAGLGDLGAHFPDTDPAFLSMDSSELIRSIMDLLRERQYHVINVDCTVIAESPRLSPYTQAMREHLSHLLSLSVDAANVKATTNEGMGWLGRREGIAAQAVVLLQAAGRP